jgi:hypothetical protein
MIRKRKTLFFSFNRKEQDFDSLDAYNDYLEMVETYSKMMQLVILHHCV